MLVAAASSSRFSAPSTKQKVVREAARLHRRRRVDGLKLSSAMGNRSVGDILDLAQVPPPAVVYSIMTATTQAAKWCLPCCYVVN
jgi:hypothetical protein